MANEIKKAIIPVAGLGTRFLPLSKVVPKELWPLADKPVLQYIVEEAKASGISEIIFIVNSKKKIVVDYFKKSQDLKKILEQRNKNHLKKELENLERISENISFSYVSQKKALGDGHAILQARNLVEQEPVAVLFADDVVEAETPCLSQLNNIFKTAREPVVALYKLPREKISSYGAVGVEKIANSLYKIKKFVEKPLPEQAPSDLAIIGKYILTPEVFKYLKKAKPSEKGEIILAEVLEKMIKDGKTVYGYECKGKWLECGNKLSYLKSNLYLSLKHPQFGPELRNFLKNDAKI